MRRGAQVGPTCRPSPACQCGEGHAGSCTRSWATGSFLSVRLSLGLTASGAIQAPEARGLEKLEKLVFSTGGAQDISQGNRHKLLAQWWSCFLVLHVDINVSKRLKKHKHKQTNKQTIFLAPDVQLLCRHEMNRVPAFW